MRILEANDCDILPEEDNGDIETILGFDDGLRVVLLWTKDAQERERETMFHDLREQTSNHSIYSLRDDKNTSFATIQVIEGKVRRIVGQGGFPALDKYKEHIDAFIQHGDFEASHAKACRPNPPTI